MQPYARPRQDHYRERWPGAWPISARPPGVSCVFAITAGRSLTAVSLTVDMWKSREASRRAESIEPAAIPSRERRGRLYVEMARGHHAAGEQIATTRLLLAACDEGVDAVRYSPAASAIIDNLRASPPRSIRADVQALTSRVGLDSA